MMSMTKIFNLPLTTVDSSVGESSGNVAGKFNLPNEARAAVVAINMHDELVEMLRQMTDACQDLGISDTSFIERSRNLLERCK